MQVTAASPGPSPLAAHGNPAASWLNPPMSWTAAALSRSVAAPATTSLSVQGSDGLHSRSWSQSSNGRRSHEPLSSRTAHMQSLQRLQERGARSPRPQTSRPGRAPSYTQLQPLTAVATGIAAAGAPAVASTALPGAQAVPAAAAAAAPVAAAPPAAASRTASMKHTAQAPQSPVQSTSGAGPQDEAQISTLRVSLMQHIESVQKEINRLQHERSRQQSYQERLQQAGGSQLAGSADVAARHHASSASSSMPMMSAHHHLPTSPGAFPSSVAALCSPQTSTRHFSVERERAAMVSASAAAAVNALVQSSSDRWRRSSIRREFGAPGSTASTTAVSTAVASPMPASPSLGPLTTSSASATLPSSPGSLQVASGLLQGSASAAGHHGSSAVRAMSRQGGGEASASAVASSRMSAGQQHSVSGAASGGGGGSSQVALATPASRARSPLGSREPKRTAAAATALPARDQVAAKRIQEFWRQKKKTTVRTSRSSRGREGSAASSPKPRVLSRPQRSPSASADGRVPVVPASPASAAGRGFPAKPRSSSTGRGGGPAVTNGISASTPQQQAKANATANARRAPHLAATRIQRAWKIQRWRRCFYNFSERQARWVGSLDWLQHHNLLYGTELADSEDIRWWMQQRGSAPLDREVDPWGSERLLEHLGRMWYGTSASTKEQQQQQVVQQQKQQQQQQQAAAAAAESGRSAQRGRSEQRWSSEAELGYASGHAMHQGSAGQQQWGNSSSSGAARQLRAVHSEKGGLSSSASATARQVSSSVMALPTGKAHALASPRQEATMPPPHQLFIGEGGSATAPGRGSKGPVLGAPPPSSLPSYKSYHVTSHSPPQTHRAPRATIPATPVLGSVALRPRSPAQSARASGPATATGMGASLKANPPTSRFSLPSSTSLQTRAYASAHRSSAPTRALSGSPPPSYVGRGMAMDSMPAALAAPATSRR
eukprot:TRINITY_DN120889_c0_g1_i1.p1 TRINITY_DN120889_c0_g1~~TRINITY_DN120889_c0_g1_i1.p1  ORF type:complete len:966 (-),score=196.44 TRINITY_DN120889_c0_g1_i1:109-2958(-)